MIFVKPKGGLCNRIRAISSALKLVRAKEGERLCVVWEKELLHMESAFESLFVVPNDFEVVDFENPRLAGLVRGFSTTNMRYVGQEKMGSWSDRQAVVTRMLADNSGDWYIETYSAFYDDLDFEWIKPIEAIKEEVENYCATLGPNCVGMHIRRTDNFMSYLYSPTSLFENVARKVIAAEGDMQIYLASDDEGVKRRFVELFGTRILTRMELAERFADGGTAQGLVDLLILARTKRIYGSYWSSFSEYAAKIGKIPHECLKDPNTDNAIQRAVSLLKTQWNQLERMKA